MRNILYYSNLEVFTFCMCFVYFQSSSEHEDHFTDDSDATLSYEGTVYQSDDWQPSSNDEDDDDDSHESESERDSHHTSSSSSQSPFSNDSDSSSSSDTIPIKRRKRRGRFINSRGARVFDMRSFNYVHQYNMRSRAWPMTTEERRKLEEEGCSSSDESGGEIESLSDDSNRQIEATESDLSFVVDDTDQDSVDSEVQSTSETVSEPESESTSNAHSRERELPTCKDETEDAEIVYTFEYESAPSSFDENEPRSYTPLSVQVTQVERPPSPNLLTATSEARWKTPSPGRHGTTYHLSDLDGGEERNSVFDSFDMHTDTRRRRTAIRRARARREETDVNQTFVNIRERRSMPSSSSYNRLDHMADDDEFWRVRGMQDVAGWNRSEERIVLPD